MSLLDNLTGYFPMDEETGEPVDVTKKRTSPPAMIAVDVYGVTRDGLTVALRIGAKARTQSPNRRNEHGAA
jgi:hypothetical protein